MQLTVYFNNSKAKQVLNLSDKFGGGFDGQTRLTPYELTQKARDLAIHIGGGNYLSHKFVSHVQD